MARALPSKLMSETIVVEFNFADVLDWAETITSVTVTVGIASGFDPSPSDLLSGSPSIAGASVIQDFTAGLGGVIYLLVATAEGSTGATYIKTRRLAVLTDDSSFRPGRTLELSGALPDPTANVAYSETLQITGGYPPYEWDTVIAGAAPFWMGFSIDGATLVCSGLPDETVSTVYSFTPQILDSANNTADEPQEIEVLYLIIDGDVPDGTIGDVVSGTYTQINGVVPVSYAVSAGTFPSGLTLAADGSYSGSFDTSALYSWTVLGTDAVGNTATVNDTANVASWYWWFTDSNLTQSTFIYESSDLSSWSAPIERTGTTIVPGAGAFSLGVNIATVLGNGAELVENAIPTAGAITVVTIPPTQNSFAKVVDGVCFAFSQTPAVGYSTSVDGGVTWVSHTAAIKIADKVGSTWIGYLADGSNSRMVYSNESVPDSWTDATGGLNRDSSATLVCNGTVACCIATDASVSGQLLRTTNGTSWSLVTNLSGVGGYSHYVGEALGDILVMGLSHSAEKRLYRSTDGGLTWGYVVFDQITRLARAESTLVACINNVAEFSTDMGATWNPVTLPFAVSLGDSMAIAPIVRYQTL